MFWIIAFLLAAQAETPITPADDGITREWVRLPKLDALQRCARRHLPDGPSAKVVMRCTSAEKDRLVDCEVVDSNRPGYADVDAAALCSAKEFRIRTTDANGQVVTGVTVEVPLKIRMPLR